MIRSGYITYVNITDNIFYEHIYMCLCVCVCIYTHTHTASLKNGKESASNVGDMGSIPGSGRFPGEGNGNPLQNSCLVNPMDRKGCWVTVHGAAKESDTMQ